MATLTVIWWRDIPAQVVARDGRRAHKIVLHPRFQVAIDKAAVKAGRKEWEAYLGEWRKVQVECGTDIETEAKAEAERLETAYDKDALRRLVASGGVDESSNRPSDLKAESRRAAADRSGAP
jgi:hypothetical protein